MRKQARIRRAVRLTLGITLVALFGLWQASDADGSVYKSRIDAHWSADNSHFWYRNDLAQGRREYVFVDANQGTRQAAFDHGRLAKALTDTGMKDIQAERLPLEQLKFNPAEHVFVFKARGKNFRCDLQSYQLEPIKESEAALQGAAPASQRKDPEQSPSEQQPPAQPYRPSRDVSPDGKWRAFLRDHNVFVRATESDEGDEVIQLSKDGGPGNSYDAPFWAPNSNSLVAFRVQPDEIGEVHLVESSPPEGGRAKLHTRRYALPGDKFTTHELNWFDLGQRKHEKPDVGLIDFGSPHLRWTAGGRHFRYEKIDRGHQRFRVIEMDTFQGSTRNIIDEATETFIWTAHTQGLGVPRVNWLKKTNEIVYLSERDGWRHLCLIDVAATDTKQVQMTQGEFVVRYVDRIDEEKRQIWFRASGKNPDQNPYLMHYYRVNFDGSGLTALTAGNGDHEIQYSPDRRFIIDTYSRIDMAPVHELRRVSDGTLVCVLEQADISQLEASGWQPPEVFSAKGRDGETDIWGIVCRPRDFDPEKKYPVLEAIYAGPHDSYIPWRFSAGRRYSSWTDMGLVVVKIDGMGTANRSKAFHDVCWKNLKDAGFPDRILWHQAYAKAHPWYDTSRVGIYGGSAGGQNSTGALLFHPDFYHVAVSSCGCHDNRMDKASWNEQWMGYPVGPQYAASSNIDNAHRLRGKLLLIVGEMDRNVPPESTLRLADALIKAGKDFELVVVPGAGHGDGGNYGHRRRVDFFKKHLLGIEPPDRNAESGRRSAE